MGSGSSINRVDVLTCPEGYSKENFQKICVLFDKLDKDSNLGVSSHELSDIAALHVKNCLIRLQARLNSVQQGKEREIQQLDDAFNDKVALMRTELEAAKHNLNQRRLVESTRIEKQIAYYSGLDESGKCNAFMKVVSNDSEDVIDFQSFFEYMKHRTDDISNITYKN
tara:strand:- start:2970 stop:3473 length:504 start_codon:yes stop_codon:yes gene_type:complete